MQGNDLAESESARAIVVLDDFLLVPSNDWERVHKALRRQRIGLRRRGLEEELDFPQLAVDLIWDSYRRLPVRLEGATFLPESAEKELEDILDHRDIPLRAVRSYLGPQDLAKSLAHRGHVVVVADADERRSLAYGARGCTISATQLFPSWI